jgi:hypothetical protein
MSAILAQVALGPLVKLLPAGSIPGGYLFFLVLLDQGSGAGNSFSTLQTTYQGSNRPA